MNILLTNDDGYFSEGIKLLFELFSKKHNVVIVAPLTVMSAKSVSIILGRDVEVKKINDHTFAMDGTPADCVAFGLSSLNTKFDLVVSGCNHGLNISYDTIYSGTIGAGLQALTYRVPAIAFSSNEENFEHVKEYFENVLDYITHNKLLSNEYLLNVNFPIGNVVEGIEVTHIYYRKETTYYLKNGQDMYFATRDLKDELCEDKHSDVYAVNHNIISITKIKRTLD